MTTVNPDAAAVLLPDLHYVGPCWSGTAYVPFWGATLAINLAAVEGRRVIPRQLRILQAILDHPRDLRAAFAERLFDYYTRHVYNCIEILDDDGTDISEELIPRLDEPGRLWELIDGPEVYVNWYCKAEQESAIEFELDFTCTWDDEHGLGVRYRDWQVEYIGGYGG